MEAVPGSNNMFIYEQRQLVTATRVNGVWVSTSYDIPEVLPFLLCCMMDCVRTGKKQLFGGSLIRCWRGDGDYLADVHFNSSKFTVLITSNDKDSDGVVAMQKFPVKAPMERS